MKYMAKNEELVSIIAEIKYRYHITQSEIAVRIGVSKQYLSDTINGRYPFNDELRAKINQAFYADVHPIEQEDPKPYTKSKSGMQFTESSGHIYIEVVKVERNALGSMGDDFAPADNDREDVEKETFEVDAVHHGQYVCFEVDGDSMDDGTSDGFRRKDVVLVRHLGREHWNELHFKQWPYWVVVFGNCVRLKQIIAQDGDVITLHSLNPSPEYTDFTLSLSQVSHLYNVVQKKRVTKFGI